LTVVRKARQGRQFACEGAQAGVLGKPNERSVETRIEGSETC
jgi:hypothetical protein